MGWTSYNATYYDKRGNIDRKAECDTIFNFSNERAESKVLKSAMRGSVYYAAVWYKRQNEPEEVYAAVCLTSVDSKDYYNFAYKDMSEDMGPGCYDCPIGILDLLTPTENEYAMEWRRMCRNKAKNKNTLSKLPIGSIIEYNWYGTTKMAEKRSPNYQFKTPWWKVVGENHYVPKSRIPKDFLVVERPMS